MLLSMINKLLSRSGYSLVRAAEFADVKTGKHVLESITKMYTTPDRKPDYIPAEIIVFSKDRPLQLHGLLCSYFGNVINRVPVTIIFSATTESYRKGYEEVFGLFKKQPVFGIYQISTASFRDQLIEKLESMKSEKIFFLVDDIVFTEKLDLDDFIKFDTRISVPTLRMGANLTRAYTVDRDQPLPGIIPEIIKDSDKICWKWSDGVYDWGYPLSVDGHLFSTGEILALARSIPFSSPNTFEAGLQRYDGLFSHRLGICYRKSKIVNIPVNKVQSDFANIHGSVHQDYLLEQWNKGMQMDFGKLYGIRNISAHQEVEIGFIKRNGV